MCQVLYEAGVIQGNTDNTFNPKGGVKRAEVAAMFSRTLDYLEDHDGMPTLAQYDGVEKFKGILPRCQRRYGDAAQHGGRGIYFGA